MKMMMKMKSKGVLTIFASLYASRNCKPNTPDWEKHLVPQIHQLFLHLYFLPWHSSPIPTATTTSTKAKRYGS
jgi:hypothetical protein